MNYLCMFSFPIEQLICSEHCPKIKSDNPDWSIGDIAKKLSEMWSGQTATDELPFEQKAA